MRPAFSSMEPPPLEPAPAKGGRRVIGLAIVALVVLGFLYLNRDALRVPAEGSRHEAVGTPLSALYLEPLVNTDTKLELNELAGQITLINYWGPWCPPCRMEMPHLVELQQELQKQGEFRFVSVSCSGGAYEKLEQLKEETARFCEQEAIRFPVYHDEGQVSRTALLRDMQRGSGFNYPTTVLLNRQSQIIGMWEGYAPIVPTEIRAMVRKELGLPDEPLGG